VRCDRRDCHADNRNAFDSLLSPVKRVAAANIPVPAGHLELSVLPTPQHIADAIGAVLG